MDRITAVIIFSCSLFPFHNFSNAQPTNVSFEHYTSENGLVSDRVADIVQDKFGFMWIATTDGLNRFDGRTFNIYRHNEHDSTTIPNDVINAICADSAGKVWVATNGGLCSYDFSVDHFATINVKKYLQNQQIHYAFMTSSVHMIVQFGLPRDGICT